MQRKLIVTKDGSHSIAIPEMQVTYHSIHGAVQESLHVYIKAGLQYWEQKNPEATACVIFEMGFGTGLNAALTLQHATKKILYEAVEAFPLEEELIQQLNYETIQAPWNTTTVITENFSLKKIHTTLSNYEPSQPIDIIYYDAFAPAAQPELWTEAIFKKLFDMLASNGILVTYCAKGAVRRALQAAGFITEKLPGPPGKREMIRAIKQTNS